jgi:hypothetical protein
MNFFRYEVATHMSNFAKKMTLLFIMITYKWGQSLIDAQVKELKEIIISEY